MTAVDTFALSAGEFCTWAFSAPADQATESTHARRLLASLFAQALDLPPAPFGEFGTAQPGNDERKQVFHRSGCLPLNYYSHADPLQVPTDTVTTGDLANDIADIWVDLMAGLWLYQAGQKDEAATEWKTRFECHWGRHATDALAALQAWHADPAHAVGSDTPSAPS